MKNKALVVIDMQEDFVNGSLGSEMAQEIVPVVRKKLREYLKEGNPVYLTLDTHQEDYLQTLEGVHLPVAHCIKGTAGHDLVAEIAQELEGYTAGVDYTILEKETFGSKQLAETLQEEEVVLVGLCTDICVVSNALLLKAYNPEREIYVLAKGCAGVTKESHEAALLTMQSCQIQMIGA